MTFLFPNVTSQAVYVKTLQLCLIKFFFISVKVFVNVTGLAGTNPLPMVESLITLMVPIQYVALKLAEDGF